MLSIPRRSLALAPLLVACTLVATACSSSTTTGPKKSNVPAAQLSTGDGYRRVYPTFVTQSVIAASDISTNGDGKLEYLVKGAQPVVLSRKAEPLSVQVAPAEPPSAVFVDSPSAEGLGQLVFVDLAAKAVAAKAVDGAQNVPIEGVYYGATGGQVLFVSGFDAVAGLGKLQWTDGTNVKDLATGAAPGGVVFSADRTRAAAVIGIDSATLQNCQRDCGKGQLITVDMKTGAKTALASDVLLRALGNDLAFSISGDGKYVAYTSATAAPEGGYPILRVSTAGGDPQAISPVGSAPSLSSDGRTVVFYAKNQLFAFASDTPSTLVTDAPDGIRPAFSPDNSWVVYFKGVTYAGQGAGVGDAWIVKASGGEAVKLAAAVGTDVVSFNAASTRVSAVGDLLSLAGKPSYEGIGNLFVGAPGGALQKLAAGTRPGNVFGIDATDALVYVGGMEPGSSVGTIFLAQGLDVAPTKVKEKAVPNSLRASKSFDSFIFIAEPDDELFEGVYRIGSVWGSTTKGPAKQLANAEAGAIQAVYSRDGRANVVIARGEKAGVWTLPTP